MELRRLQLANFRNYHVLDLAISPGMHIFAGANAQGKTNLLEAIYVAAARRSPRTSQEGELIAWEEDVARVVGHFASPLRGAFTVEVALGRRATGAGEASRSAPVHKRIKVNGAPRRVAGLAGLVPAVLFLADDLEIIRGEPAHRRAFLDDDLAAMSRTYAWNLRQYSRVIEQRNRLLKAIREGQASPDDLGPWNTQLAAFGGRLVEVRTRFTRDLNEVIGPLYRELTASEQTLSIAYRREWGDAAAAPDSAVGYAALLTDALRELEVEEVRRGSTLAGPHRDDLYVRADGTDMRQFGSQGEQRTAALALRVAEFSLLHRLVAEPPVLLLDDILSELDRARRAALLDHLAPIAQVILTTTDVDAVGLPARADVRVHRVVHGEILDDQGRANPTTA